MEANQQWCPENKRVEKLAKAEENLQQPHLIVLERYKQSENEME